MNILILIGGMLLIAFAFIGLTDFIYLIVSSYSDKRKYQCIEFEKFKELYAASPDKWQLEDNLVSFVKVIEGGWKRNIVFRFSLKDRYYYKLWKRNIENQKRQEKYSKELQEVIQAIKEK